MNANTKVLTKNGHEDDRGQEEAAEEEEEEELAPEECNKFRMLAARLRYMAQDSLMFQFPAKEVKRNLAQPKVRDIASVKTIVRFMLCWGEVHFKSEWQRGRPEDRGLCGQ
jgi:hypothetical protein